jgi:hypothetical protein
MLETDTIQQSLVVLILQTPPAQVLGNFLLDSRGAGGEVTGFVGALVSPQLTRLLEQLFQC